MKFIRTENNPHEITIADGEAGRGVYFALSPSVANYYKNQSPQGSQITAHASKDCQIIDFRAATYNFHLIEFIKARINKLAKEMVGYVKPRVNKKNYQRFGRLIEDFLNEFYSKADGYIVYHGGPNIPSGAQLVVRDLDKFILVE
jgi:hypothetical protein